MILAADTPVLQTERLTLRVPDVRDTEAVIAFFMSDRAAMAGGVKETRGLAWRAFAGQLGQWCLRGFGTFAVTFKGAEDRILGMVGPHFPEGWVEREIGWLIFEGSEGKGIAQEAAIATRRYAYDVLGWETAVSYIDPANTRSIALAERLGARLEPDTPHGFGEEPCLVYRHPGPAELAA